MLIHKGNAYSHLSWQLTRQNYGAGKKRENTANHEVVNDHHGHCFNDSGFCMSVFRSLHPFSLFFWEWSRIVCNDQSQISSYRLIYLCFSGDDSVLHQGFGLLNSSYADKRVLYLWIQNNVGFYIFCHPPYSSVSVFCLPIILDGSGSISCFSSYPYLEIQESFG